METFQDIRFERIEPRIAQITLARPKQMNAYSTRMCEELVRALEAYWRDDELRVVILTGEGRGFCAGGDVAVAGSGVLDDLLARRKIGERQIDLGVGCGQLALDRRHRFLEHRLDAIGQLPAISLRLDNASARQRILIGPAASPEESNRARMSSFEIHLREAGIIAGPEIKAQYRRMAGIAANKRSQTPPVIRWAASRRETPAWQAGFQNVTCSLGTNLNARQLRQLGDGSRVYLAFDADQNGSGQKAA